MVDYHISPSQLSVFRECPKRYEYKYIQGRVPVHDDSEAMVFGRLWDDATGVLWASGGDLEAVVAWLTDNVESIIRLDAVKVAALLEFYDPPIGKYEFVGNQEPVTFNVMTDEGMVPIKTKSDTLLRDKTKRRRLIVREAKTTTFDIVGDSPYWQTLQINTQVAAYWLAHRAYGVLYDVVKRPTLLVCGKDSAAAARAKLEPGWDAGMTKKAQSELLKAMAEQVNADELLDAYGIRLREHIAQDPDVYFQFRQIFKTKADLERDEGNLTLQADACATARRKGKFPMYEHSCVAKFGRCPYLDVCTGKASLADGALFENVPWKAKPF
jgi:hypothetical protein